MPYKDKNRHAEYRKERIETNRKWVRELKETSPCADCRKFYPFWVMQFDHLRDKYRNIALMMAHSEEKIREEIEKCELVCANCHATRSYNRGVRSQSG